MISLATVYKAIHKLVDIFSYKEGLWTLSASAPITYQLPTEPLVIRNFAPIYPSMGRFHNSEVVP
jgi:hypothetical protein